MGPHLSAAKVVEAGNPARDPLLRGDLLFNPAWDPTQKTHVALVGIIDLNGSGVDGTQDLVRALEKQGIVVDAWLDLKDRTIKGPGMTERTTYLIKGERPLLPPNMPPDGNPLAVALVDVIGKIHGNGDQGQRPGRAAGALSAVPFADRLQAAQDDWVDRFQREFLYPRRWDQAVRQNQGKGRNAQVTSGRRSTPRRRSPPNAGGAASFPAPRIDGIAWRA